MDLVCVILCVLRNLLVDGDLIVARAIDKSAVHGAQVVPKTVGQPDFWTTDTTRFQGVPGWWS
jgi:hypothetical protein